MRIWHDKQAPLVKGEQPRWHVLTSSPVPAWYFMPRAKLGWTADYSIVREALWVKIHDNHVGEPE